jgi:hypothetical protein
MTCQELRQQIHDFLDGELPPRDFAAFNEHVKQCAGCQRYQDEFSWLKNTLSVERLSQSAQEMLWKRVRLRVERNWKTRILELGDLLRTSWRDLDRGVLWSKLTAAPVTLVVFAMILTQFGQDSFHEYPMLATLAPTSSPLSRPVIAQVSVHYQGTEFEDLMTAVWKIPFEDSLSLVAKITPDGSAEIGDVLEYPKSPDLLEAVELTLSGGQFQTVSAQNLDDTFVIYSFQKVDVYENRRGL